MRISILLFVFLFVIASLAGINFMLADYESLIFRNYSTGEIISEYKGILVDHQDIEFPSLGNGTLKKMGNFFLRNPVYILKLSLGKLIFFFAHIKPYYSSFHNTLIILIIYPLYFFSIKSLSHKVRTEPIKIFFVVFTICQAAVVMLYMEDWDGRFLLPLLPIFMITGGTEMYKTVSNYFDLK